MSSTRATAYRVSVIVAAAYVLVCLALNTLIGAAGTRSLDEEVHEALATLARASTTRANPVAVIGYFGGSAHIDADEDLKKVPVAYWWVPSRSSTATTPAARAIPADAALPSLPKSLEDVGGPVTASIGGSPFRIAGESVSGGRWVVAMSTTDQAHDVRVAELAELVILPVVMVGFFLFALAVGRSASAPVETARRKLLAFTADASHELRTPVSVIEAEVGVALRSERDAAGYRATLERVARETERMKHLIEELLWLARFDGRPKEAPFEEVDLAAVAESVSQRLSSVAAGRNMTIVVDEPERHCVSVRAPAEWLERLVSVLVDNACRYGAYGSEVKVSVGSRDGSATLTVDDAGPGIAEEEREAIFRRFHRATTQPGGSGLGLAIADAIVEATGGRWSVETSPAGGARFRVSW
jgi:signal transduction histidine kinase